MTPHSDLRYGLLKEKMSMQESQDERKAVQKRTFTRWMNVYLSRRDPPTEVHDLFQDVQDGRMLMILLEELTGCKLLYRFRSSSNRIFRLNNISKALVFLDDRHVKLPGIDASAVADGVPSVVLNLIWNIILHFQVKEMTGGLHRRLSLSLSSLSVGSDLSELTDESVPSPGRSTAKGQKYNGKTIKTLLYWVQGCTEKFGVEVHDFGKSWRSGLAFLALIKSINPSLVDLRQSLTKEPKENLEEAFRTAHQSLDIPPLLEPQDVACSSPDEKSIITYVSMFLRHCPDMVQDLSTAVNSPIISKFRSLETLVDTPEAHPQLTSFDTSHELLLWKRWVRRSSSGSHSSPSLQNKRRSSSVLQPPSPLDAGIVNSEIRLWLDRSSDHGYSKSRLDEIHFSLSSEEGIYSVTPLDSDEEDAYSYILDLNKDVFQSQAKRQVPRVEEETAEEIRSTNDERGKTARNLEVETQRNLDLDGDCNGMDESNGKDMRQNDKMQNVEVLKVAERVEEGWSKEESMEDLQNIDVKVGGDLKAPSNNISIVKKTYEDTNCRNINVSDDVKAENDKNEQKDLKASGRFLKEVVGQGGPKSQAKGNYNGVSMDVLVCEERNIENADKLLHSNSNSKIQAAAKAKDYGESNMTSTTSSSGKGIILQSVAPSGGLTPFELHMLLFLWMLLYCCFIGHQLMS